jgi:hypothetical protein
MCDSATIKWTEMKRTFLHRPSDLTARYESQRKEVLFFATSHFLKTILASSTNGTFGFARYTSRPFAKPKEPFFTNAPKTIYSTILN